MICNQITSYFNHTNFLLNFSLALERLLNNDFIIKYYKWIVTQYW